MIKQLKNSVIIVLLVIGLAACASSSIPMAPLPAYKPSVNATKLWSNTTGFGSTGSYANLTPVADDGVVYIPSYYGFVSAVNQKTGRTLWRKYYNLNITTGLAVSGKQLFVGTGDGFVLAIKRDNGRLQWKQPVSSEVLASPTADSGRVYVKTEDGMLVALNASNGKQLWSYQQQTPSLILRGGSSPIVVDNHYVLVGFSNGQLVAVDKDSGNVLWAQMVSEPKGLTPIEQMVDIDTSPIVTDSGVFVASYQGNVVGYDRQSARLMWQRKISTYQNMAADGSNLYLATSKGAVEAVNQETGAVVWRQDDLKNRQLTAPALIGDYLVVGDKAGYLHWLSTTDGHYVGRIRIDRSGVSADPVVVGKTLYAYSNIGRLAKYQLTG